MCAENYQNRDRFDKDIAKIKRGSFFLPHMVVWFNVPLNTLQETIDREEHTNSNVLKGAKRKSKETDERLT